MRRSPMKRSTIKRKTPMQRTAMKRSRPRPRYTSDNDRQFYFEQRELCRISAEDQCQAGWHESCPTLIENRESRRSATDGMWHHAHHIKPRRYRDGHGSGNHHQDNLLWVCEECHGLIHSRPDDSIKRGFLFDWRNDVRDA